MTDDEKKIRLAELARTVAHANGLGVRAELMGDAEGMAEAERIYSEAMKEIAAIRSSGDAGSQG